MYKTILSLFLFLIIKSDAGYIKLTELSYSEVGWVHRTLVPTEWKEARVRCLKEGFEFRVENGNCYKFHTKAETWNGAIMTCALEGAQLAMIDTLGEEQIFKNIFSQYPSNTIREANFTESIHLGFRDWNDHKTWITIHGETIDDLVTRGITQWEVNEPNNINGYEYCGNMLKNGALNDAPCYYKLPFICEY